MTNLFVTSDIHGHMKHFKELLEHWNQEDHLIIIGDLIDRGPESVHVIYSLFGSNTLLFASISPKTDIYFDF